MQTNTHARKYSVYADKQKSTRKYEIMSKQLINCKHYERNDCMLAKWFDTRC